MAILGMSLFANISQWYYNGLLNFTQCIVSLYVTPVIRSSDSDIECVISSHDCAFFIAWNHKKWAEKIHLALFLAASFILGHYDNSLREEMFREDICLIIIMKHKEWFQANTPGYYTIFLFLVLFICWSHVYLLWRWYSW